MKILNDKTEVSSRIYYYLLDWNESNEWEYIREEFDKGKLNELNIAEFRQLFKHASTEDYRILKTKS